MKRLVILLLAASLPMAGAAGQSLAELAENSKKKRKKDVKVYTEDDLRRQSPEGSSSPAPSAGPGVSASGSGSEAASGEAQGSSGTGEEGGPREGGRQDEAYWRKRTAEHHAGITRAIERVSAVQARLDALMVDLVPTNLGDPFREQNLEAERAKARQELEEAKQEVERLEDAFHAFEEEARRKGIPPGWLEDR